MRTLMRQGVIRFAIVGATPGLLSLTECEDVCIAVIQPVHVRFGSEADIRVSLHDVRFTLKEEI